MTYFLTFGIRGSSFYLLLLLANMAGGGVNQLKEQVEANQAVMDIVVKSIEARNKELGNK